MEWYYLSILFDFIGKLCVNYDTWLTGSLFVVFNFYSHTQESFCRESFMKHTEFNISWLDLTDKENKYYKSEIFVNRFNVWVVVQTSRFLENILSMCFVSNIMKEYFYFRNLDFL